MDPCRRSPAIHFCAGEALGNTESDKLIGGELPVPCLIGVRIGKFGDCG